jgi:hypothetical protein
VFCICTEKALLNPDSDLVSEQEFGSGPAATKMTNNNFKKLCPNSSMLLYLPSRACFRLLITNSSVVDQKRFDADPDPDQDPNLYFDADQDPEPIIDTVMTNFK